MAVSNIFRSQPTRLVGLSSGMDTDGIIQATLRMHQFKIDKQMRSKKVLEWKQQNHTEIKNQISSLMSTYLSNLGSKSMMSRNTYNTNLATALTASGKTASAVTVSASVNATLGSMTINQVVSLAKGYSVTSSSSVSKDGNGFLSSATLGSLTFSNTNNEGKIQFYNYQASVKNEEGNVAYISQTAFDAVLANDAAWSTETSAEITLGLDEEATKIQITREKDGSGYKYFYSIDGEGKEEITFDSEGKAWVGEDEGQKVLLTKAGDKLLIGGAKDELWFESKATVQDTEGRDVELTKTSNGVTSTISNDGKEINKASFVGTTKINVGDGTTTKEITLTSDMTIAQMLEKVNKSGAGVTMSYDRMQDKFTFESNTVGDASQLSITAGDGGNILSMLAGSSGVGATSVGSDAVVKINGVEVRRQTNTFDYRGVTIKLNHVTEEDDEAITVTVKRDTDKAFNAIKDFIDSYNLIIKKLEGLLNERKTGSEVGYTALTDEEKASMTEKQIEEWEAIAKKGIMRGDTGLERLVSSLRASFFAEIEGTGLSPAAIGLTTGNFFDDTGGQIIINEEKLRAALEEDPDRIADVFVKIDRDPVTGQQKGVGLMHKIDDLMREYVRENGTQSITTKALETSLKDLNDRIAKMEEKMWAEEEKLYRQFAAMETALSKMQQQGDWFSSMLGG